MNPKDTYCSHCGAGHVGTGYRGRPVESAALPPFAASRDGAHDYTQV